VLRYYFAVKLIKFDEVGPPEHVISKKFGGFEFGATRLLAVKGSDGHRSALETVAVVFGSDRHNDDALIVPVEEDRADVLLVRLVKEEDFLAL